MALLELTARFLDERFRFANDDGDTIIGEVETIANGEPSQSIAIKGKADQDELRHGITYRFWGKWTSYKNRRSGLTEKQFAFDSFVPDAPCDEQSIIAYLEQHGEGRGIGRARCKKIWELFGTEAVKICRTDPIQLANELNRCRLFTKLDSAKALAAALEANAVIEQTQIELAHLLGGRGFPKGTAKAAVKLWGNEAAEKIKENPYIMMRKLPRCGFKTCDNLYTSLGLPPTALIRQSLCAWYEIASDNEGHTWYPRNKAVEGIRRNVGGAALREDEAIQGAVDDGMLAEVWTAGVHGGVTSAEYGSHAWIAEGTKATNERDLGKLIADATKEKNIWPAVENLPCGESFGEITEHQRDELAKAIAGPVGVLGGGPGTGKTYTLAILVKILIKIFGINNIGIGAPTGKAAVRVTENLSKYGIPLRARTWHSHLACLMSSESPFFPYKVLIGDETSMNDTDLMAAIFRARAAGTHVLFVGDVNQLAPVGHGAPLRDMIAAGLPYGELREIKRNSGGIVEACAAIRDGNQWAAGDNLHLVDGDSIQEMRDAILHVSFDGLNPIWDCQVLTAVNEKSPLARKALNKILQAELNTKNATGNDKEIFRVADKIVNTKNGYFPIADKSLTNLDDEETKTNDRDEVYVANGELAEVLDVQPGFVIAKLSAPDRVVKVPRGRAGKESVDSDQGDGDNGSDDKKADTGTGCSWELGYCLSTHKSQGSEWNVVIVMLDDYPGAKMVCSREWIYTAISRAKDRCVLIGKKSTADAMCRNPSITKRKTLLKETILRELAAADLSEI